VPTPPHAPPFPQVVDGEKRRLKITLDKVTARNQGGPARQLRYLDSSQREGGRQRERERERERERGREGVLGDLRMREFFQQES